MWHLCWHLGRSHGSHQLMQPKSPCRQRWESLLIPWPEVVTFDVVRGPACHFQYIQAWLNGRQTKVDS